MKRPCLWPALGFAVGILAVERISPRVVGWLAFASCAAFLLARRRRWEWGSLVIGWGLAGGLAWWSDRTPLSERDLRLESEAPVLVEIEGTVDEMPTLQLSEFRGKPNVRTTAVVTLSAWRPPGESWQSIVGTVMTTTQGAAPQTLFVGQQVTVRGLLRMPPQAIAPGLFDYRNLLRYRGISRLLEAESFADWRVLEPAKAKQPWSASFLPWAQRTLAQGLPDDEATRLLWAMTLGWRTALTDDLSAAFVEAGTMHVFAISGLHIALLSGVLVALLRVARVNRALCGGVVIPATWMYVAATGWQPSAVRSAVMMSIVVGGWALRRPSDVLNSLAWAALGILVVHPGELFQAGFQLSFAAVAGLALWVPAIESFWQRRLQPRTDPFLPNSLRPAWRGWLESGARGLGQSLALSASALAATLPLTIHYFHWLSPISLLANLVVVPLSSLALAANVGSLAVAEWLPALATVFNASAWVWMKAMVEASRWFAAWPGGVWAVPDPWPGWWVAYYALLITPVSGWFATKAVRRVWLIGAAVTALGALATLSWTSRRLEMALLPGGTLVIDGPGWTHDLILNTGGTIPAQRALLPWLRAQGWNRIPRFIVTQADAPHVGGATEILGRFVIGEIGVGSRRQRSPAFQEVLEFAVQKRVPLRELYAGTTVGDWRVISPARDNAFRTAEDNALVLVGSLRGIRFLILPSLGVPATDRLWTHLPVELTNIDVIVTGSPSRMNPGLRQLVDQLDPQLVVFSGAESAHEPQPAGNPQTIVTESGGHRLQLNSAQVVCFSIRRDEMIIITRDGPPLTFQSRIRKKS